jgi:hypothetical protein
MAQGILERFDSPEEEQRLGLDNLSSKIRVCIPGIVETFDPAKQTATVQPAITENIRIGQEEAKPVKLPVLTDVPVHFPRAGGYSITLPVKQGDECILVFADMCIDGWWQSGGTQDQIETRRHDLSDAFAIMGATSQPKKIENYHADNLQMRTDDQSVIIEIDKAAKAVNVTSSGDITLTSGGAITITAAGKITINGSTVDINE